MSKLSFKRPLAALLAAAMSLSCVVTAAADEATGGPDSDITNWNPISANFEATADGYVVSGSNNEFVLSDKNAKDFSIEADVTMLGGEGKATFVYGATNSHSTSEWRGVELWVKDNNEAHIKAFVERGPMLIDDTTIEGLDRAKSTHFKIEVTDGKLTATVNDKVFTQKADVTDSSYVGGTVGLLAYSTTAQFNHIRFSGSETYEGSQIKNWTPIGDTNFVETKDYYQLYKGSGDAILLSDVAATSFEYEASMKIIKGDRATLTFANSEPVHGRVLNSAR